MHQLLMKPKITLITALLLAPLALLQAAPASSTPNIVLILADDLGYGTWAATTIGPRPQRMGRTPAAVAGLLKRGLAQLCEQLREPE